MTEAHIIIHAVERVIARNLPFFFLILELGFILRKCTVDSRQTKGTTASCSRWLSCETHFYEM